MCLPIARNILTLQKTAVRKERVLDREAWRKPRNRQCNWISKVHERPTTHKSARESATCWPGDKVYTSAWLTLITGGCWWLRRKRFCSHSSATLCDSCAAPTRPFCGSVHVPESYRVHSPPECSRDLLTAQPLRDLCQGMP
jgi:hypothetical protein